MPTRRSAVPPLEPPLVEQPPRKVAVRTRQVRTILVQGCGGIMAVLLWRVAPILRNHVRFSPRTRAGAGRPSSGLKRLSDQDPIAGACRRDLPPRAAHAVVDKILRHLRRRGGVERERGPPWRVGAVEAQARA